MEAVTEFNTVFLKEGGAELNCEENQQNDGDSTHRRSSLCAEAGWGTAHSGASRRAGSRGVGRDWLKIVLKKITLEKLYE